MDEENKDNFLGYAFFGGSIVFCGEIFRALFRTYTFLGTSPIVADGLGFGVGAVIAIYLTERWFPNVLKRK